MSSDIVPAERQRVVVVTQPYWPDIQSTSHLLTELLEASAGEAEFEVICGYPVLTTGNDGDLVPAREERNGVQISRCGVDIDYKKSLFHRAIYLLAFSGSATWRLIRIGRRATVIAVTNPPFSPIWMLVLSSIVGFRYRLICHDVFPDGLVAMGKLSKDGLIARFWRKVNRRAYSSAEITVALGRDMADLLHSNYGVERSRILVAPHWSVADGRGAFAPEQTRLWSKLGLRDSFVVQYSGNMGLWHDIDAIVRAAALLQEDKGVRFLLIGGGMRRARAEELAAELGVNNIDWLPFQSEEELSDSLASCHLAIVSQRAELRGIAVPCKLYGVLASGRGILAMVPEGSEVALVVEEEGCGVRIDPSDPERLASEIRRLSKDSDSVRAMGRNAYAAFDTKYRLQNGVASYRRLWEEIPASSGSIRH